MSSAATLNAFKHFLVSFQILGFVNIHYICKEIPIVLITSNLEMSVSWWIISIAIAIEH